MCSADPERQDHMYWNVVDHTTTGNVLERRSISDTDHMPYNYNQQQTNNNQTSQTAYSIDTATETETETET